MYLVPRPRAAFALLLQSHSALVDGRLSLMVDGRLGLGGLPSGVRTQTRQRRASCDELGLGGLPSCNEG
jgi:hypothetical protein